MLAWDRAVGREGPNKTVLLRFQFVRKPKCEIKDTRLVLNYSHGLSYCVESHSHFLKVSHEAGGGIISSLI